MTDVHDTGTRSYNMSQIRSKDTKPELLVRKFLFANGLRYKLHDKKIPGTPDIVLPKYKSVIFVNGCFWHGHDNCKYFVIPKTRTDWWLDKINYNKKRDEENYSRLMTEGWKVFSIFECELMSAKQIITLTRLLENLKVISTSIVE
jgi:DNA mismatch endonuclease (patch repair protein)